MLVRIQFDTVDLSASLRGLTVQLFLASTWRGKKEIDKMMLILEKPIYSLWYKEPSLFLDERRERERERENVMVGRILNFQQLKGLKQCHADKMHYSIMVQPTTLTASTTWS